MKKNIFFSLILITLFAFLSCKEEQPMTIEVTNETGFERLNESIEIDWSEVIASISDADTAQFVIRDSAGSEIPFQVLFKGEDTPQSLLLQVSMPAYGRESFTVDRGIPSEYKWKTYGRFIPERDDDFAWENDKIAFRMYGPALEAAGEISNGIDVWVKSTDQLIIDKWYANENYHLDNGEGLDCYKVGRTLGAGAMAPIIGDELILGNNFTSYEIIDKGALRISFKLQYAPYYVNESEIVESRIITLDAGTNFNRVEEIYENMEPGMEVAAGIVLREGEGIVWTNSDDGLAAYWEPQNNYNNMDNGHTAIAVIFAPGLMKEVKQLEGHLVALADYPDEGSFVYHVGAAWSKGGVPTVEDWQQLMAMEVMKLRNPLKVTVLSKGFR